MFYQTAVRLRHPEFQISETVPSVVWSGQLCHSIRQTTHTQEWGLKVCWSENAAERNSLLWWQERRKQTCFGIFSVYSRLEKQPARDSIFWLKWGICIEKFTSTGHKDVVIKEGNKKCNYDRILKVAVNWRQAPEWLLWSDLLGWDC